MAKSYNYSTGLVFQVFSDNNYSMTLSANTEQHFTVPSFSQMGQSTSGSQHQVLAVISPQYGKNIWVANNLTAIVANSSAATCTGMLITSDTPVELRTLKVKINDVLSFITSDTSAYVGVSFYQG